MNRGRPDVPSPQPWDGPGVTRATPPQGRPSPDSGARAVRSCGQSAGGKGFASSVIKGARARRARPTGCPLCAAANPSGAGAPAYHPPCRVRRRLPIPRPAATAHATAIGTLHLARRALFAPPVTVASGALPSPSSGARSRLRGATSDKALRGLHPNLLPTPQHAHLAPTALRTLASSTWALTAHGFSPHGDALNTPPTFGPSRPQLHRDTSASRGCGRAVPVGVSAK